MAHSETRQSEEIDSQVRAKDLRRGILLEPSLQAFCLKHGYAKIFSSSFECKFLSRYARKGSALFFSSNLWATSKLGLNLRIVILIPGQGIMLFGIRISSLWLKAVWLQTPHKMVCLSLKETINFYYEVRGWWGCAMCSLSIYHPSSFAFSPLMHWLLWEKMLQKFTGVLILFKPLY